MFDLCRLRRTEWLGGEEWGHPWRASVYCRPQSRPLSMVTVYLSKWSSRDHVWIAEDSRNNYLAHPSDHLPSARDFCWRPARGIEVVMLVTLEWQVPGMDRTCTRRATKRAPFTLDMHLNPKRPQTTMLAWRTISWRCWSGSWRWRRTSKHGHSLSLQEQTVEQALAASPPTS